MNELIERYLAVWNETNADRRRALIDELFTKDVTYVDPMVEASGRDALGAAIAGARAQFPDWTFTLIGPVDTHHRQARFAWTLGPDGGESVVVGFDVAVADEQARLISIYGFLDKVPAWMPLTNM